MKHNHAAFRTATAYVDDGEVNDRIRRFLPMVNRAAWHIYGTGRDGLEIDDLMQVGMIALTECARRHSGPTEDGFAAYAKTRVRGAMLDQIRKLMPDSRTTVKRRRQYEEAEDRLRGELGRAPTRAEIAARIGCGEAELPDYEVARTRIASLDEVYDESNTAFAAEMPDPFEVLASMDDRDRLVEAMSGLNDRLKLVLQLFYVEELNLTEIAEVLEVSVPRVHQLRGQALAKLKALMEAE